MPDVEAGIIWLGYAWEDNFLEMPGTAECYPGQNDIILSMRFFWEVSVEKKQSKAKLT